MAIKQRGQSGAALAVTNMIRHALSRRGQQELYQLNENYVRYDFYQDEFTLSSQFGRTICFGWVPSQEDPEFFCEIIYYAELPAYKSSGEIDRCLTANTYLQMLRLRAPSSPIEISTSMMELLYGSLAAYAGGSLSNRLNLDHFKVVPTQPHDPKWQARSLQVAQLDWTLKTQA